MLDLLDASELLSPALPPELRRRRRRALDLAGRALAAVEPASAVGRALAGRTGLDGCVVFAFGKAAVAMTEGLLDHCVPRGGLVVAPVAPGLAFPSLASLEFLPGDHPLPGPAAVEAGRRAWDLASALGPRDQALCLVSGGGSAMLELPAPGHSLEGIRRGSAEHMAGGGSIVELNRCRTAWSRLKGGGLGRAMAPARILNLVLSDVPGQGPELVASGPTVVSEAETLVVGDNLRAQCATGLQLGEPAYLEGEARDAGARFYAECGDAARVAGGETTVTVRGPGRGGRNQEFVLGALVSGYRGGLLLSLGTDGADGSSSLAGALLDEEVVSQAAAQGLDPEAVLEANDSESFFRKAGGGVETGPTGTNVADLVIYLP